jgi:hypothetical protein
LYNVLGIGCAFGRSQTAVFFASIVTFKYSGVESNHQRIIRKENREKNV